MINILYYNGPISRKGLVNSLLQKLLLADRIEGNLSRSLHFDFVPIKPTKQEMASRTAGKERSKDKYVFFSRDVSKSLLIGILKSNYLETL